MGYGCAAREGALAKVSRAPEYLSTWGPITIPMDVTVLSACPLSARSVLSAGAQCWAAPPLDKSGINSTENVIPVNSWPSLPKGWLPAETQVQRVVLFP